jgi:RimJ/RimL family protein N-acetyltransferase
MSAQPSSSCIASASYTPDRDSIGTGVDPARYSATETLRDGRSVEIRALRPAERKELLSAVDRISDQSIYRRFFSPKRSFTDQEVAHYVNVDFVDHVALVAELQEDGRSAIVGGARYIVSAPGAAEVAFAVDDAHQGQGIGAVLMTHLAAIARRSGLKELFAEVLPSNTAMLKVFEKSGLGVSTKREHGVVHVTLRI